MYVKKLYKRFMREKFSKKIFFVEWLGLALILSMVLFVLFFYQKNAEIGGIRAETEATEKSVVILQKGMIDTRLEVVSSDLEYVSTMCSLARMLNAEDESDFDIYREEFQRELSRFIKVHDQYDQIRYIGADGQEITRVNFDGKSVEIVEGKFLQNKGDRYYFEDTMKLESGQIYQSTLDLNIENGKIEKPEKPMIRFAIRVFDEEGLSKGIVIINYNARSLLKRFNEISDSSDGESYLLNSDGYFIAGNSQMNFDFMYNRDSKEALKYLYPDLWRKIKLEDNKDNIIQDYGRKGFVTFTEVSRPGKIITNDKLYILDVVRQEENKFCTKNSSMGIILSEFINRWHYFLAVLALSYFAVLSLTLYRKNIKTISEMASYDKLTGAYSRSRGLEIIETDIEYARRNQMEYSLCFIDLNDLKKVNDTYGHDIGDQYLKDSVGIIKSRLGYRENIIRMGGDEFLVGVFKSNTEVEQGWKSVVEETIIYNNKNLNPYDISLSHGVVSIKDNDIEALEHLISIADKRMYEEKRQMKSAVDK